MGIAITRFILEPLQGSLHFHVIVKPTSHIYRIFPTHINLFVFMAQGCEIYDAEEVYYHFHIGIKWAAPSCEDVNSQ